MATSPILAGLTRIVLQNDYHCAVICAIVCAIVFARLPPIASAAPAVVQTDIQLVIFAPSSG